MSTITTCVRGLAPWHPRAATLALLDDGRRCSIQSSYQHVTEIGHRDFVLIDEAHLVSRNDGPMYRRLLRDLQGINPRLRIIGLTATAYRLDTGRLHEGHGRLFDAIAYQAPLLDMVEQGYLTPVRAKLPRAAIDVSGVGKRGGEFIPGQLEAAADQAPLTEPIADEIVAAGADRGSWLIFCSGVSHAGHVRDAIRTRGITCETVTGDTPNAAIVGDFKSGAIRALTNVGVFTTGRRAPRHASPGGQGRLPRSRLRRQRCPHILAKRPSNGGRSARHTCQFPTPWMLLCASRR